MKVDLDPATTAVVISQPLTLGATLEEFAILVEFAIGVLTISGFQPVSVVATLSATKCLAAAERPDRYAIYGPTFPKKIGQAAANAWLRRFFTARSKVKDHMHITADRFVRYCRTKSSYDSLLDLCICLESLLDSQTEISFRFGTCLAKVAVGNGAAAEELSGLLMDLYDFRSKLVHGTNAAKKHKKIDPHVARLRQAARTILTGYVLYMSEHSRDEWKKHLRSSLFA